MVNNGYGNFSIPNNNPRDQPGRRVWQRPGDHEEEPSIIPIEDELPMDPNNVALRRYQDNKARGINYTNIHLDIMMQHMNINRPSGDPVSYPYIPTW